MVKIKGTNSSEPSQKSRPALSPESRENQLISLAVDVAEEQLRNRTASSQVITHFLKLATTKAQLEKEKLEHENRLLDAKTKAIESEENREKIYAEAIAAMKKYSGHGDPDDY